MLEILSIFVIITFCGFGFALMCIMIVATRADEFDLEFTIEDKTILDIHKYKEDDEEEE